MSGLRSLQRGAIRNQCYKRDHHKRAFKDEWNKIHYGVVEETDNDKVVATKKKKVEKKKQRHFDDGKSYVKYLKAMKTYIDGARSKQSKANTSAKAKVC